MFMVTRSFIVCIPFTFPFGQCGGGGEEGGRCGGGVGWGRGRVGRQANEKIKLSENTAGEATRENGEEP